MAKFSDMLKKENQNSTTSVAQSNTQSTGTKFSDYLKQDSGFNRYKADVMQVQNSLNNYPNSNQFKTEEAYNAQVLKNKLDERFNGYSYDRVQSAMKAYSPDSDEYKYLSTYTNYTDLNDFDKALKDVEDVDTNGIYDRLKASMGLSDLLLGNDDSNSDLKNYKESLQQKRNQYALDHAFDNYKGMMEEEGFDGSYDSSINDEFYRAVNGDKTAKDRITARNVSTVGNIGLDYVADKYSDYSISMMTDEEKAVYNYLYSRSSKEADDYLNSIKASLNKREYDSTSRRYDMASDGFLGGAVMSALSIPVNVIGGVSSGAENIKDFILGIQNPYSKGNYYANLASDIRENVSQNIADATGSNVYPFLYQTGMSIGDSLLGVSALGKAYTVVMGANAYQQKYREAIEAGETEEKAQASAIASGVAEIIFEKFSLDTLLKPKGADGWKAVVKSVLQQSGVEGSEEAFTELSNKLTDTLVRMDTSDVANQAKELKRRGYTDSEIAMDITKSILGDVTLSALGGALSGGVMGAGAGAIDYYQNSETGKAISSKGNSEDLFALAENSKEGSELYDLYTEYSNKGVTGDNATNAQLGNLYNTADRQNYTDFQNALYDKNRENDDEIIRQSAIREDLNNIYDVALNKPIESKSVQKVDSVQNVESEENVTREDFEKEYALSQAKRYGELGLDTDTLAPLLSKASSNDIIESYREGEANRKQEDKLKAQRAKAVAQARKLSGQTVTFDDSSVDKSKLTNRQNDAIELLSNIMQGVGVNAEIFESEVENGKRQGESGSYEKETNTIKIDAYAGINDVTQSLREAIIPVGSHELTHMLETKAPELYTDLRKAVSSSLMKQGISFDARIESEKNRIAKAHPKQFSSASAVSDEYATAEIIARACEDMLTKSEYAREIMEQLPESQQKSFIDKVKAVFENLKKFLDDLLSSYKSNSREATFIRQFKDDVEEISRKWDKALREASAVNNGETIADIEAGLASISGQTITDGVSKDMNTIVSDTALQMSERTYAEGGRDYLVKWLKNRKGISQAEAEDILLQTDKIAELMKAVREGNDLPDYSKWANMDVVMAEDEKGKTKKVTVIVKNGDYAMNIDFSQVCKKRVALNRVLNQMVKSGMLDNFIMGESDVSLLNSIIKEEGFEIACALCFVDSKRYRVGSWANSFCNGADEKDGNHKYGFNEMVKSLVPKGSKINVDEFNFTGRDIKNNPTTNLLSDMDDSKLDFTLIDSIMKSNDVRSAQHRYARAIKENASLRKTLNPAEIISSIGYDSIRAESPELFKLINGHQGTAKPKFSHDQVVYKNDILQASNMTAKKAYMVGGVRLQSFSDFMTNMVFDYVQMVSELSAKKLPVHTYTKEAIFVKLFGLTGMKINMSLVPKAIEMTKAQKEHFKPLFDPKPKKGEANYEQRIAEYNALEAEYESLSVSAGLVKNEKGEWEYIWEDETFPYDVAMDIVKDPEYSKNCGTIAVGISRNHIIKLLNDDTIHMVIPYHKSGLNHEVALMRNIALYHDYTSVQNTRYTRADGTVGKLEKGMKDFNFYEDLFKTKDPKQTAKNYLAFCDEHGYTPKFDEFAYNENYYKLLADFRLYDNDNTYAPQQAVKPIYPDLDTMKDLIVNGYTFNGVTYGGLKQQEKASADLRKKNDKIIDRWTSEMNEKAGKDLFHQYSDRDSEYLELAKDPKKNESQLQSMVSQYAKANGYNSPMLYHGTSNFGFTKLDTANSDDKFSFFVTDSLDTAKTYAYNSGVRSASDYKGEITRYDLGVAEEKMLKSAEKLLKALGKKPTSLDTLGVIASIGQSTDLSYIESKVRSYIEGDIENADKVEKAVNNLIKSAYTHNMYLDMYEKGSNGVYSFYGNTEGFYEIDAKGKSWAHIEAGDALSKYVTNENRKNSDGSYTVSTREIAKYAYESGYPGVIIRNVVDNGGKGKEAGTSTVYAFFNPSQNLKSADSVTYDNKGKVIPLSERFGSNNDDIRYSDRNTAEFNGKSFWSGAVNLTDGVIEEVHSIEEAKKADYHHTFYFSENAVEKIDDGEYGFFWVDNNGNVVGEWRDNIPKDILKKIYDQITIINADKESELKNDIQYSYRGINTDGYEVYETSQDTLNLTWKERIKEFESLIKQSYAGKKARFVRNGHTYYAELDRKNPIKPLYGEKHFDNYGKKAFINAGADGDYFDLLEKSRYVNSKADTKNHKRTDRFTDYFDYFDKTVQIDNRVYDVIITVKKKYGVKDGYTYTLFLMRNKNKKASPAVTNQSNVGLKIAGNASNSMLSQQTNNVNTQNSDRDNVGYHAGDLGKAEPLSSQGYDRGTGHFGTGTYFVGNEAKINIGGFAKRPHETVDFSDYNLYKPIDYRDGKRLHEALKILDGKYIEKDWIDPAIKGDYNIVEPYGYLDLIKEKYGEHYNYDLGFFVTNREAYEGDNKLNTIQEYADSIGMEYKSFDDWYNSLSDDDKDFYDEYNTAKENYVDYLEDEIKNYAQTINDAYNKFRRAVDDLKFSVSWGKDLRTALMNTADYVEKSNKYAHKTASVSDSVATYFMKQLGYEGVDVRHIDELDNTEYGSVIYDLKGEGLARKQEIGTARFSDRDESTVSKVLDVDTQNEINALLAEVENLNEKLKLDKQLTGGNVLNENQIKKVATRIKTLANSKYNTLQLVKDLTEIYNYLNNTVDVDATTVFGKFYELARAVAGEERATVIKDDYMNDISKAIINRKIKLTPEIESWLTNQYGKNFRQALRGLVYFGTNEGVNLDERWNSLSQMYPETFDAEISGEDQLQALIDIASSVKEASKQIQTFNTEETVKDIAYAMYDGYWDVSPLKTTADKYQDKIDKLNREHSDQISRIKERNKGIADKQKQKDKEYYGKIIKNLRDQRDNARKDAKKRYDKMENTREKNRLVKSITDNTLALNKQLKANSVKQHVPESMKKVVVGLINSIDYSSKSLLGQNVETKKDMRISTALEQVKDMLYKMDAEQREGIFTIDIPTGYEKNVEDLTKALKVLEQNNNPYVLNDMSVEQLKELDKIVKIIKSSVNNMNKWNASTKGDFITDCEESMAEIDQNKTYVKSIDLVNKVRSEIVWREATPIYAFERFGKIGKKVFASIQDGWDKFAYNIADVKQYAEDTFSGKECDEWEKEIHTYELHDSTVKISTAQLMSLYCLMKREHATNHVLTSGIKINDIKGKNNKVVINQEEAILLSKSEVDRMLADLTPRQLEVAEKLQKFMNTTCTDWGNEITMARYGFNAFEEKNYFPIKVNENHLDSEANDRENSFFRLLNLSFTNPLVKGANGSIEIDSIFNVFASHSSDMAKYNALALPVLDAYKWFSYRAKSDVESDDGSKQKKERSVKSSISKAFGKDGTSYISTFLKDLNGDKNVSREIFGKGLFSAGKMASVGFNARVVALQPTSYFRAMNILDADDLTIAFTKKNGYKKAEENCGIAMWKSLGFYDVNVGRGLTEMIKRNQTAFSKIQEASMMGAGKADEITIGYLWNACEHNVKKNNKNLSGKALDEATALKLRDVIYHTQVVDSTMTRSEIMRSSSYEDKLRTAFLSEPTLSLNMLMGSVYEYSLDAGKYGKSEAFKKNGKKIARAFTAYTITNLIASIVEAGFDALRSKKEELDEEELWNLWLENFKDDMSVLGKIPVIKDVISVFKGYSQNSIEFQSVTALYSAWKEIEKAMNGKKMSPYKFSSYMLKSISYMSGIALSNGDRDIKAVFNRTGLMTYDEMEDLFNKIIGSVFPFLKV